MIVKNNLFVIFFLLANLSYTQHKNFVLENGIIYWKNIYKDSAKISELRNKPLLEFITDSTGFIKRTNFNDKKLNDLKAEFKIESKQNKYRVSVYNIRFFDTPVSLYIGNISTQSDTEFTIEKSILKEDGSVRKYAGYNLTATLNPYFVDLFTIEMTETDNW